MYHIGRIGTSFLYLLLTNGTPLTILRTWNRQDVRIVKLNIFILYSTSKAIIPRNLSMETLKSRSWSLIYTYLIKTFSFDNIVWIRSLQFILSAGWLCSTKNSNTLSTDGFCILKKERFITTQSWHLSVRISGVDFLREPVDWTRKKCPLSA